MLTPIKNSLETMEAANKQVRALISKHQNDPTLNINPLSMKLGGMIDAVVMGGVSNYEKVWKRVTEIGKNELEPKQAPDQVAPRVRA